MQGRGEWTAHSMFFNSYLALLQKGWGNSLGWEQTVPRFITTRANCMGAQGRDQGTLEGEAKRLKYIAFTSPGNTLVISHKHVQIGGGKRVIAHDFQKSFI